MIRGTKRRVKQSERVETKIFIFFQSRRRLALGLPLVAMSRCVKRTHNAIMTHMTHELAVCEVTVVRWSEVTTAAQIQLHRHSSATVPLPKCRVLDAQLHDFRVRLKV